MLALPFAPLTGVLLLTASLLLVILECNRPGLVLPGAAGLLGLLLVLASLAHSPHPGVKIVTFCAAAALTAAVFRRPNLTLGILAVLVLERVFRDLIQPDPSPILYLFAFGFGLCIGIGNMALARIAQRARINKGHSR